MKSPYQVDKLIVKNMTSSYLEFVEELLVFLNDGKNNKKVIRKLILYI